MKTFHIPKFKRNPEKQISRTKVVSWVTVAVGVLTIADQFLDWGIIDKILALLNQ